MNYGVAVAASASVGVIISVVVVAEAVSVGVSIQTAEGVSEGRIEVGVDRPGKGGKGVVVAQGGT